MAKFKYGNLEEIIKVWEVYQQQDSMSDIYKGPKTLKGLSVCNYWGNSDSVQKEKEEAKKEKLKRAKQREYQKKYRDRKKERARIKKEIDELMTEVKILNNQFNRFDIMDIE